jgi:hypothetical protein
MKREDVPGIWVVGASHLQSRLVHEKQHFMDTEISSFWAL